MIRVLSIGPFDPCRVSIGHKRTLAGTDIEYRVAVKRAITPEHVQGVDWYMESVTGYGFNGPIVEENKAFNAESLFEYALDADVIQIHPGIGDGMDDGAGLRFVEDIPICGLDVRQLPRRRRVAYFHGSKGAWQYLHHYARHYEGWALAASTLDYACELPAAYLPPLVELYPAVPERQDDEPLVVCQTTTDPAICHQAEFVRACKDIGITPRIPSRWLPHDATIAFKAQCNAGFDHLRGAFSVNTLENCSLGLVSLVGLKPEYQEHGLKVGLDCYFQPAPRIFTEDGLRRTLALLNADAKLTRHYQRKARAWFQDEFSQDRIRDRLLTFYRGLA